MDDEIRTMKLTELKARVAGAQYDIDVDAVAEAFVARMVAARAALRRADVRALLGERTARELQLPAG
jgi:hypothetical protein